MSHCKSFNVNKTVIKCHLAAIVTFNYQQIVPMCCAFVHNNQTTDTLHACRPVAVQAHILSISFRVRTAFTTEPVDVEAILRALFAAEDRFAPWRQARAR